MARFRKIDARIWNDEKFQILWRDRWGEAARVPRSRPYPHRRLPLHEQQCLSVRLRFKREKSALLAAAIERLGSHCVSCGSPGPLFPDHVIPIHWGGTNDPRNIQPLCAPCNGAKGGTLPEPPHA